MAEKEYIERDAVYNMLNEAMTTGMVDVYTATQRRSDFEEALEAIELVPTADVQPVKHGRWIINSDGYYPQCSECMSEPQGRAMTDFCPNCGAKMDGGDE